MLGTLRVTPQQLNRERGQNLNPRSLSHSISLQFCFWKALEIFAMAQPSTTGQGIPPAPTGTHGSILSVLTNTPKGISPPPFGRGLPKIGTLVPIASLPSARLCRFEVLFFYFEVSSCPSSARPMAGGNSKAFSPPVRVAAAHRQDATLRPRQLRSPLPCLLSRSH